MRTRSRTDFDLLLRDLVHVGFGMLLAWSLTGVVGVISQRFTVQPQAALRFLLAILVVVFARRTYWEVREWHHRRASPDDEYGFTSPL
jgi:ABC-type microcin C transport system permease subunit YejB